MIELEYLHFPDFVIIKQTMTDDRDNCPKPYHYLRALFAFIELYQAHAGHLLKRFTGS